MDSLISAITNNYYMILAAASSSAIIGAFLVCKNHCKPWRIEIASSAKTQHMQADIDIFLHYIGIDNAFVTDESALSDFMFDDDDSASVDHALGTDLCLTGELYLWQAIDELNRFCPGWQLLIKNKTIGEQS